MNECPLHECKDGHAGFLSKIEGHRAVTARLTELGFVPGQWIRVIRTGNPIIVQVGDSRFCLRQEQILGITIISGADNPAVQSPLPAEI